MKRRIKITVLSLIGLLFLFGQTVSLQAATTGSIALSVSAQSVNIGDTVTVSVQAKAPSGEAAIAVMNISFDSSVFEFVSCSDATYGGGGSNVSVATDSATITLKAIAQGTSSISVSGYNGVVYSSNEDIDSMSGSSASVTVENAAAAAENQDDVTTVASADNSLSALSLSAGTLAPTFKASTTKYTATVANDVTEVKVSAKTSNEKAQITSVTGNTQLKVGANTIEIIVKAENNTTATYTITLTRAQEETAEEKPEESSDKESESQDGIAVMVNERNYFISEDFSEEEIPQDFTQTVVTYQDKELKGLKFNQAELYLLYLVPEGEQDGGSFFIYDNTSQIIYPFIELTCMQHYIILLEPSADADVPKEYEKTVVSIGELGPVTAYKKMDVSDDAAGDFYLVYAINKEGVQNWYQYDTTEGTYQRFEADTDSMQEEYDSLLTTYNDLNNKLTAETNRSKKIIFPLIFVSLISILINIVLLIKKKRPAETDEIIPGDYDQDENSGKQEDGDWDDEQDCEDETEDWSDEDDWDEEWEDGEAYEQESDAQQPVSETTAAGKKKRDKKNRKAKDKKDTLDVMDFNDL